MLDHVFWTSVGPFARLDPFNLFIGPETAMESNFVAWFIIDYEEIEKKKSVVEDSVNSVTDKTKLQL